MTTPKDNKGYLSSSLSVDKVIEAGNAMRNAFADWVAEASECDEDSGPASIYVTAHDIMRAWDQALSALRGS